MLSSLESHCVLMSHGLVLSLKKQKQNIPFKFVRCEDWTECRSRQCPKKNFERPQKSWRNIAQDHLKIEVTPWKAVIKK